MPEGFLVLGYGNTLRGDDGVGPRVAEAFRALGLPGVRALACAQLAPELADPMAGAEVVVFVDAALGPLAAPTLRRVKMAGSLRLRSHNAEPGTLLALARGLFGHCPRAWLLSVPAGSLALGEALSDQGHRGMASALKRLVRLHRLWRSGSGPSAGSAHAPRSRRSARPVPGEGFRGTGA